MANNNEKLYITISDNRGQTNGANGKPTPQPDASNQSNNSNDNTLMRYAEHQMFHLVKSATTKAVNFSLANIGNFSGDYIAQRNVNAIRQEIEGVISIGMTTFAGAKYGPVSAAIGFVVGASSLAMGTVFEEITNSFENSKANFNIEMLRERVGLNTIYDGSRGTEN